MIANPDTAGANIEEGAEGPEVDEMRPKGGFWGLFLPVMLGVLALRVFVVTPFNIPSESMLPGLIDGDYLVAAKWPYGYSRWSLPFDVPIIEGKIAANLPERGDIAIFRHPIDHTEYIKRVIGLPGDTVAMRGGIVILNGKPVPKRRIDDFTVAVSPNTRCAWGAVQEASADGGEICRYARFAETLPSGRTYMVLDFGATPQDDYPTTTVPQGHVFVMGDNRDNSQDSRFPLRTGGGVGMVPAELLAARAEWVLFSTDGSAEWYKPWTWFTAARWNHMGERL